MEPLDFALTREQVREIDRIAIEEFNVHGLILMENAGRACADEAEAMLRERGGEKVFIFCGPGNNGGDGFVVARHLANRGYDVEACLVGEVDNVLRRASEASTNLEIALRMDIPVREVSEQGEAVSAARSAAEGDLIVDGLLGTGLTSEVREPHRSVILALNESGVSILAIDVPSGLDCNTGRPLGVAIKADRTVSFVLKKVGFTRPGSQAYTGVVRVAEISVPQKALREKIAAWRGKLSP